MKYIIRFPSGRYFIRSKDFDLWGGPCSTTNLLEADTYDNFRDAKQLSDVFCGGSTIISIPAKDLFLHKLKGTYENSL